MGLQDDFTSQANQLIPLFPHLDLKANGQIVAARRRRDLTGFDHWCFVAAAAQCFARDGSTSYLPCGLSDKMDWKTAPHKAEVFNGFQL